MENGKLFLMKIHLNNETRNRASLKIEWWVWFARLSVDDRSPFDRALFSTESQIGAIKNFSSARSLCKSSHRDENAELPSKHEKLFQTADVLFGEFDFTVELCLAGNVCLENILKTKNSHAQRVDGIWREFVVGRISRGAKNLIFCYLRQLNIEALILLRRMLTKQEFNLIACISRGREDC